MLGYYPLEHLYYLLTHSLIPATVPSPAIVTKLAPNASKGVPDTFTLNPGAISRASVRFWAVYNFLQFFHLREDRKQLILKERALNKSKAGFVRWPYGVRHN